MNANWAVLLLAHGAPERLEDIPEFLLEVRGGRPLPEAAVREITHRYAQIGGGTPLRRITEQQGRALQARLHVPVAVAMRNWKPFIADVVAELPAGVARLVVICLAPQNSRTSVGLYRRRLESALEKAGARPQLHFVESWHNHPLLIRAFAEKLRAGLQAMEAEMGAEVPVILTAHSVPERTIADGDPYDRQVHETAALVASAARLPRWRAAYQSQGMTREPWIGPTVEWQIDALAAEGQRAVFIAPIGFLADHAEILYDIDIHFRQHARAKGMELRRSESLNDSPLLIDALAALAREQLGLRTLAQFGWPWSAAAFPASLPRSTWRGHAPPDAPWTSTCLKAARGWAA